ncbi:MAG TPA: tetratricopeptide repeat protein [Chitinophagaceae bacterium]|nr:tetratricopeptide repeat protein [Chitinophagaceae bacterium]
MKKRGVYIIIFFLFVFATSFIILRSTKQKTENKPLFSELLYRVGTGTQIAEWKLVKAKADELIKRLKNDPEDKKLLLSLTSLYVNEGRVTGNLSYYNDAALKCTETVLKNDPENFEALTFKSMILLSQHRFEDGLAVALQVQKKYPYNAFVYGLIIDGNVELGNYPAALEAADRMVSIRPDLRSYSRIAYLREIYGDIAGAIEAMKMAVDAGAPGDENTEWCRVQTGKLYEQLGKIKDAAMHYTIAADNRADYPYAMAGLARIATAEKDLTKAISLYEKAVSLMPDHTFKEGMSEVYTLMGQEDKAKHVANEIMEQMQKVSSDNKDQNEDHEMAHAYMGVNNYEKALEYALKEYNRRTANIEVNQTVAIVHYAKGEYARALPYIEKALKTNCKNPELRCHAGLIYAKSGDRAKARMFLNNALNNNPVIPPSLKKECEQLMKWLN